MALSNLSPIMFLAGLGLVTAVLDITLKQLGKATVAQIVDIAGVIIALTLVINMFLDLVSAAAAVARRF